MKALLLAAGRGRRLSPITDRCPKSMIPVNGKPILVKQMENLMENGISDIIVIAGYRADIILSNIVPAYPNVRVVINEDYSSTNNMYSAFLARNLIRREAFIMMNSDVYFDATVIRTLLSDKAGNSIVTDRSRYLGESMKVIEEHGRLVKIGKDISEQEASGVSIDVYKFSPEGNEAFFHKCQEYIELKKELNLWTEVAINDIFTDIPFAACPLNGRWVEIDTHGDLREAENLFF
jgi:choline kinase